MMNFETTIILEDFPTICPKCKYEHSLVKEMKYDSGKIIFGECKNCGAMTFQKKNDEEIIFKSENTVTCPFCQSTNCKKISGASKIGKVALFGVFAAGNVSKTWHCNNCGSNFG